jgi:cytohesin
MLAVALFLAFPVYAFGQAEAAQAEREDPWAEEVRRVLTTPPERPRRVMLVFPLVEEGSEDGVIGWGRGLIALQAMWRSSFAPDRLLDTWDFWVQKLYVDQQLLGPGRRVTDMKMENLRATFDCENYTTGTLSMGDDQYVARLTFHGQNGERRETYSGPAEEIYRLPCRIAEDVVDYMGVEVTVEQRGHLRRPMLNSKALLDQAADRILSFWREGVPWVSFWEELLEEDPTPWTHARHFLNRRRQDSHWALWHHDRTLTEADHHVFDYWEAEARWTMADRAGEATEYRSAARRLLPLVSSDPYNAWALSIFARSLGFAEGPELARLALDRFDLVYGDSSWGRWVKGRTLVNYAWDARGSGWASEVKDKAWRLFHGRLREAKTVLEGLAAEDDRLWPVHRELIRVGMGLELPDAYTRAHFEAALEACPDDFGAWEMLFHSLLPRWGSREDEGLELARQAVATERYKARIPFLIYGAHWYVTARFPKENLSQLRYEYFQRPEVIAEIGPVLMRLVEENPHDYVSMTLGLQVAFWTGQRERARDLLHRLGAGEDLEGANNVADRRIADNIYRKIYQWATTEGAPLHDPVEAGDRAEVAGLLQQGASPVAKDQNGQTPLHRAAARGRLICARLLLAHGASVNIRDERERTPLLLAAENNDLDLARLLFDAGADVNVPDDKGRTPLHWAAYHANGDMSSKMIEWGADPNIQDSDGQTPLHYAVWEGHEKIARLLLGNEADPMVRDSRGEAPLAYAAAKGRLNLMKLLFEHGADVHAEARKGFAALHRAGTSGDAESVKWLLGRGVKVDQPAGPSRSTPLQFAACGAHAEAVGLLIGHGADVNFVDVNDQIALHGVAYASAEDDTSPQDMARTARLLLENGSRLEVHDKWGNTPLHVMARHGTIDAAAVLLEHGADIHAGDDQDRTPLHKAVRGGHPAMVRFLVEYGADVNRGDKWPLTPLHRAADRGQADMVRLLLKLGADPTIPNNGNRTPGDLAEKKGHTDLAALLRRAEAETR